MNGIDAGGRQQLNTFPFPLAFVVEASVTKKNALYVAEVCFVLGTPLDVSHHYKIGQGRAGQGAIQDRTGQNSTGQNSAGQDEKGQDSLSNKTPTRTREVREDGLKPHDGSRKNVGDRNVKLAQLFSRYSSAVRNRQGLHCIYKCQTIKGEATRNCVQGGFNDEGKEEEGRARVEKALALGSWQHCSSQQANVSTYKIAGATFVALSTRVSAARKSHSSSNVPGAWSSVLSSDTASFVRTKSTSSPLPTCSNDTLNTQLQIDAASACSMRHGTM